MKLMPPLLTLVLLSSCAGVAPLPGTPKPASVSTASPVPIAAPPFSITGYLPEYRGLNPEWGLYLTDLIYFSAEPRADGTLDTSRLSGETWQGLQTMKVEYGTRLHLTIGGWERSAGFAPMTASPEARARFVKDLLAFAEEHQLDGAGFDWEFPESEAEFQNYITLLTEVKAAFAERQLLVSVALSADNAATMDLAQFAVVDYIHVMSYDRGRRHSTYDQAVEDMRVFTSQGLKNQKLLLGVPFYGRAMSEPYAAASYQEIVAHYHPAPSLDEVDGIYFNGPATLQRKTCFAREGGFGGIMIWEVGQDTWDETSLLRAIAQAALNGC